MTKKTSSKVERSRKPIPFEFIFDLLYPLEVVRKPMFGCTALYLGERILLILREKEESPKDNGIWIATTVDHHESLKSEFPDLRSISLFETAVTSWQNLPSEAVSFESAAEKICEHIKRGDIRIGKIPAPRKKKLSRPKS